MVNNGGGGKTAKKKKKAGMADWIRYKNKTFSLTVGNGRKWGSFFVWVHWGGVNRIMYCGTYLILNEEKH